MASEYNWFDKFVLRTTVGSDSPVTAVTFCPRRPGFPEKAKDAMNKGAVWIIRMVKEINTRLPFLPPRLRLLVLPPFRQGPF